MRKDLPRRTQACVSGAKTAAMAEFSLEDQSSEVHISRYVPNLEVAVDGRTYQVEPLERPPDGTFNLKVDNEVIQGWCREEDDRVHVRLNGKTHTLVRHQFQAGGAQIAREGQICADLPGNLVSVHCKVGDKVRAGDLLMITESMKMEVRVLAKRDGEVMEFFLEPSETFEQGAPLLRLKRT